MHGSYNTLGSHSAKLLHQLARLSLPVKRQSQVKQLLCTYQADELLHCLAVALNVAVFTTPGVNGVAFPVDGGGTRTAAQLGVLLVRGLLQVETFSAERCWNPEAPTPPRKWQIAAQTQVISALVAPCGSTKHHLHTHGSPLTAKHNDTSTTLLQHHCQ
jgi:hypothetical protein